MSGGTRRFSIALLMMLWGIGVGSEAGEDKFGGEEDMEDERLIKSMAGTHFEQGCYQQGTWANSCDISKNLSVLDPADWSPQCDPWKEWGKGNSINMTHTSVDGKWTCPEKYRSESGCGDFRHDPRQVECKTTMSLSFDENWRSERIITEVAEPLVPQKHVCVAHPVFYDNMNTAGKRPPPIVGRHRERWPKWGEYGFLPPQRWLHAIEHGGIAFLYNHCLDEESLCLVRRYILKVQKKLRTPFRFVMTPFKDLSRPLALVSWGSMLQTRGFNEMELDMFMERHYRHAWEDYGPSGPYDHLWRDISAQKTTCDPTLISLAAAASEYSSQFVHKREVHEEVSKAAAEITKLRATTDGLTYGLIAMATALAITCGISLYAIRGLRIVQSGRADSQENIELTNVGDA